MKILLLKKRKKKKKKIEKLRSPTKFITPYPTWSHFQMGLLKPPLFGIFPEISMTWSLCQDLWDMSSWLMKSIYAPSLDGRLAKRRKLLPISLQKMKMKMKKKRNKTNLKLNELFLKIKRKLNFEKFLKDQIFSRPISPSRSFNCLIISFLARSISFSYYWTRPISNLFLYWFISYNN